MKLERDHLEAAIKLLVELQIELKRAEAARQIKHVPAQTVRRLLVSCARMLGVVDSVN